MQQFPPTKILVPEESTGKINNQTQQQQPNQNDKKLPRRCLHALASLAVAASAVKRAKVKISTAEKARRPIRTMLPQRLAFHEDTEYPKRGSRSCSDSFRVSAPGHRASFAAARAGASSTERGGPPVGRASRESPPSSNAESPFWWLLREPAHFRNPPGRHC